MDRAISEDLRHQKKSVINLWTNSCVCRCVCERVQWGCQCVSSVWRPKSTYTRRLAATYCHIYSYDDAMMSARRPGEERGASTMIVTPPPKCSSRDSCPSQRSVSHTHRSHRLQYLQYSLYILCLWWVLVLRTVDLETLEGPGAYCPSLNGLLLSRWRVIYSQYLLLIVIFLPFFVSATGPPLETHTLSDWRVSGGE